MTEFAWFELAIYAVAFGALCAVIAPSRNRSAGNWFVLGALCGVFALVALLALPALDEPEPPQQLRRPPADVMRNAGPEPKTPAALKVVAAVMAAAVLVIAVLAFVAGCTPTPTTYSATGGALIWLASFEVRHEWRCGLPLSF